ncbi:MAG: aminoglycoside phosphotransferase family protein [Rhodospirillales bacterium]|nr:aminoglycoside phosphotransferase family protein [Rhodospirillales bacterium]
MNNQNTKNELVNWSKKFLANEITDVQEIAATAFSYVLKIDTSDKSYYLKKTPPKLYIEARVLDILNTDCALENVPKVIATNDELHCFLMPSCGDLTLRTLFEDKLQQELLYKGVHSYTELQKASADHIQKFLDIGVPDWRIENLPNIYTEFINDDERLAEWGLNTEEQKRCKRSQELFPQLCAELANLNLPDVLNHSDFHPNAMLLDQESNEIKIIDLGEVTIGNPLLPLASCITNYLEHRWKIRSDEDVYTSTKETILKQWELCGDNVMDLI